MCGIAGFTHSGWSPDPGRIESAVATLTHRGPDQQGSFDSPICSLGATRLKILDLESGDQPIRTDDGQTVIAFNGEIYNHLELRAELESKGHRFRTRTDTETLLHAFLEWDTGCFARLRGMFGVALWHAPDKRLVLARDRMGIKPLYTARLGRDLLFGSELKAIFVHPEFDRRLSLAGLDCYLSLNYVPCPWTLAEGIEKLPPGHWLEWRDREVRSQAYWQLPFGVSNHRTIDSVKEELDHLLQESVREHLLSDVPLGVWLSGGIDSSTVLHYAAKASPTRLKTLSISFAGRTFDETSYIRQVVSRYGTDHHEFDLNPAENLPGVIEEFAYYNDEPDADAGALPLWYLSKMTKSEVTVALSGEGGDELFGGYLTYRANRLARHLQRFPAGSRRFALACLRRWPVSDDKISLEYMAKRFVEGSLLPPEQAHVYWNGTFSAAQKATLLSQAPPAALDSILGELRQKLPAGDDLAPYLWFDQKYFLPDDILMKVDRMSMAHAVEARPVLLDHRIVEFAASLPAPFKIRGSRQKCILKDLMSDRLPASVLSRKKTGLDIPAHEWLRGPLRPLLSDALRAGASEYSNLFRFTEIEACLRRHMERQENLGYHLWGLMILFLWMRRWRIQLGRCPAPNRPGQRVLTSTI
ncbi:MAG: asparagine synthase (glutamine-hydrolyzing) [Candidatus Acidiferrales bacterium]